MLLLNVANALDPLFARILNDIESILKERKYCFTEEEQDKVKETKEKLIKIRINLAEKPCVIMKPRIV